MPVSPNFIPAYREHKSTNRAVVRLNGKDHYLGRYGTPESRAKYDKTIADWLAQNRAVTPTVARDHAPPALTVTQLCLAFWKHAESHYRGPDGEPTGELATFKAAIRPLRALHGSTPVGEFGPMALRAVQARMVQDGLARTVVNARVNRVRRMFRWGASMEYLPVAVVQGLETVPGLQKGRTTAREPEPVGPVAVATVEATLPHLSRTLGAMVRLQLLTGMRPGEVCKLRGIDLVADGDALTYRPPLHKTAWRGKVRSIPLGPKARAIIAEFARADPHAALFDPRDSVAEYHALRSAKRKSKPTPSEQARRTAQPGADHSRCYNRNTYGNAIDRACRRAFPHPTLSAIKPKLRTEAQRTELAAWDKTHTWHPNQLRHTQATAIASRYGIEAAHCVLGHAKPDVTMIYVERDTRKARAIMDEIG